MQRVVAAFVGVLVAVAAAGPIAAGAVTAAPVATDRAAAIDDLASALPVAEVFCAQYARAIGDVRGASPITAPDPATSDAVDALVLRASGAVCDAALRRVASDVRRAAPVADPLADTAATPATTPAIVLPECPPPPAPAACAPVRDALTRYAAAVARTAGVDDALATTQARALGARRAHDATTSVRQQNHAVDLQGALIAAVGDQDRAGRVLARALRDAGVTFALDGRATTTAIDAFARRIGALGVREAAVRAFAPSALEARSIDVMTAVLGGDSTAVVAQRPTAPTSVAGPARQPHGNGDTTMLVALAALLAAIAVAAYATIGAARRRRTAPIEAGATEDAARAA